VRSGSATSGEEEGTILNSVTSRFHLEDLPLPEICGGGRGIKMTRGAIAGEGEAPKEVPSHHKKTEALPDYLAAFKWIRSSS